MSTLLVGYGEQVINPPVGTELTGYGYYPDRGAEGVLDDIKVRVLFLQEKEKSIVLISCDLLGFSVEFADTVRREISLDTKIPLENILISFIHTHTGPACQRLRGCGNINEEYLKTLPGLIKNAVRQAVDERKEAEVFYSFENLEPIGFNRRNRSFSPIDPLLKVIIFKREDKKIYLTNYACHPVVLGRIKEISSDWPGAFIREVEKGANYGIFFQGFCGDIDPVTNLNRWGGGTKEDIDFYGELLYNRVLKCERYATEILNPNLKVIEKRIRIPLNVPGKEAIEEEEQHWLEKNESINARRFIQEWAKSAKEKYQGLLKNPYMDNIPVQMISIGELRMVCLPGEVFCEYGIRLRKRYPALLTIGYANGVIGYIPTKRAYRKENDYACYIAPKIYNLFPFLPEIEDILMKEIKSLFYQDT